MCCILAAASASSILSYHAPFSDAANSFSRCKRSYSSFSCFCKIRSAVISPSWSATISAACRCSNRAVLCSGVKNVNSPISMKFGVSSASSAFCTSAPFCTSTSFTVSFINSAGSFPTKLFSIVCLLCIDAKSPLASSILLWLATRISGSK